MGLKAELAIYRYAGRLFYNCLYDLETDRFIAHTVYDKVEMLRLACSKLYSGEGIDDLVGEMSDLSIDTDTIQTYRLKLKQIIEPAKEKLDSGFFGSQGKLSGMVKLFRALQLLNPIHLCSFNEPQIHSQIAVLVGKLPTLKTKTNIAGQLLLEAKYCAEHIVPGLKKDLDVYTFWTNGQGLLLPSWQIVFQEACLLAASSACAERSFKQYQNKFPATKESALEDFVEAVLLLCFNTEKPDPPPFSSSSVNYRSEVICEAEEDEEEDGGTGGEERGGQEQIQACASGVASEALRFLVEGIDIDEDDDEEEEGSEDEDNNEAEDDEDN